MRPGKLTERLNWSVTDDPALFQLEGKHRTGLDPSPSRAANAGERLYGCVSSARRSAACRRDGFVLFTIRVHTYPLSRVTAQHGARRAPGGGGPGDAGHAMAAYKSLPPFRAALLGYLDGAALVPSPSGRGLG